ncbi:chalcone isomerase family protein [Pseudoalteromonas sp. BDTF-M6]|uniref:chalcone isomerase family protein n=1 Tax=Pseudoalteromonas sp. BDTF-M6 TaxID=2796132 RepID=UPI001BAFE1B1|nr:chalcone isomerase family protein [Pseudoalteromonas sp. BDTF-M6]MBS3797663.1 chalcone isomerase family protein [Pseudoalteromonas sp. BDTF-M6]
MNFFKCALVGTALMLSCPTMATTDKWQGVGEGVMRYLFWDIYHAELATDTGDYRQGQHPMRLSLTYLRDIEGDEITKATLDQWRKLDRPEYVRAYKALLTDLWPDVSAGDTLSFVTDANGQGAFFFNGELLQRVEDPAFSEAFTAIWLSPKTTEPGLRAQLLGGRP